MRIALPASHARWRMEKAPDDRGLGVFSTNGVTAQLSS